MTCVETTSAVANVVRVIALVTLTCFEAYVARSQTGINPPTPPADIDGCLPRVKVAGLKANVYSVNASVVLSRKSSKV